MLENQFEKYLTDDESIESKTKAVASRISKARAVERRLNQNLDMVVADDTKMYNALVAIKENMNDAGGSYSNALRKYYQFKNGVEFPRMSNFAGRNALSANQAHHHDGEKNFVLGIKALLEKVSSGLISPAEAEDMLKDLPYEDLGFAKLDHHRALRSGFGEVVYCAGKTPAQAAEIFAAFSRKGSPVLGTRADANHYKAVSAMLPESVYDEIGRTITYGAQSAKSGVVAVCTGGTSDMPVAEECAKTAEFFGTEVSRFYDVGVAGIHRLFSHIGDIRKASCIVAVAGMEGALAGVIAGLVDVPVIAVPTSVGYGANFGGLSALLTMLNSCAEGVSVVNIDNGFGAGYLAAQICRLAGSR